MAVPDTAKSIRRYVIGILACEAILLLAWINLGPDASATGYSSVQSLLNWIGHSQPQERGFMFTVIYMASGWFVQHRVSRFYQRIAYSQENLSFRMQRWRATLEDEGVRFSSAAADALYRWSFVREVVRDSRYIRVVLTPARRVHIPVRAFSSEEDIQKFVSAAQSFVKRHAASP